MNIVLLGPPGSGKGTQARRMSSALGVIHLSTGDVFRDAIKNKTTLGNEIKNFVDAGRLVPDELVSAVVFEKLGALFSRGFLLDGYPRTVGQAEVFDRFLAEHQKPLDAVIFFEVEFPELVRRLSSRRQCPKCKRVYNVTLNPPKQGTRCDSCGTDIVHRPDDQPEIVRRRLDVYRRETEPILDYYKDRAEFRKINAAQEIDRVFKEVMTELENVKSKTPSRRTAQ